VCYRRELLYKYPGMTQFKSIDISRTAAGLVSPEGGNVTKVNFKIGVFGRVPRRMASALIRTRWHAIVCLPASVANGKRPFSRILTPPTQIPDGVRDATSVLRKECWSPFFRDTLSQPEIDTIEYCLSNNHPPKFRNFKHSSRISFVFTKLLHQM